MDWRLVRQTLEIRYTHGFRLWDVSGVLTANVIKKYPDLNLTTASPERIVLDDKKRGLQIIIGMESTLLRAMIATCSPTFFYEACDYVLEKVLTTLQIEVLTRIGHRVSFNLRTKSDEESKQIADRLARKLRLGGDFLDSASDKRLKGKRSKEVALRFEDEKTGLLFQLKPIMIKLEFEGILMEEWTVPPPAYALDADIDVYTIGLFGAKSLLPTELLKSNIKLLESEFIVKMQL